MTTINMTEAEKRERRIENLMHEDFGGMSREHAEMVVDGRGHDVANVLIAQYKAGGKTPEAARKTVALHKATKA